MLKGFYGDMMDYDKDKTYYVKLFRLFDPKPKLIWEGKVKFHIKRRPDGTIGVLTPKPEYLPDIYPEGRLSWAEYCQEDLYNSDANEWVCEDYLMEVYSH